MSLMSSDSTRFADYVYKVERVRHMCCKQASIRQEQPLHIILLMREASGRLDVNGRSYSLHPEQLWVLSPDDDAKLHTDGGDADYYEIGFTALQAAERGIYRSVKLDCPKLCVAADFRRIIGMAQEMERLMRGGIGWDAMKANVLFQELIIALFREEARGAKPDLNRAIQRTMEFMEKHYASDITRERLADMVGLSADYYSRAFKRIVRKSPMEALTEIRLNRAKQLLVRTNASYRSIASSVGYSDEFYFSRKFKAEIGCSPKAYVKKFRASGKIASLHHLTTGNLLALNVEPYAAVIDDAYPVAANLPNTIAVGSSRPDLEKLLDANPDVIVVHGSRDENPSPREKLLHQIAPTVTLRFYDDWRAHLQTIAAIVGKENEAAEWLERYETKASAIRKRIAGVIGDDRSLIVGIGEGKLCVYGQRNLGTVLYGDLRLPMPAAVEAIAHYREVAVEELDAFCADRIFITSFKQFGKANMDRIVRSEVARLSANPHWRRLKAVRNQQIYWMHDRRHLFTSYNAFSHNLLLDKVDQLLSAGLSKK